MTAFKYPIVFLPLFFFFLLISCSEDDPLTEGEDRYIALDRSSSEVPQRIQYGRDILYSYRIAFDTNYMPEDSLTVISYFTAGQDTVPVMLFDDGYTDDSLRCDLAASNNVWSGRISALSFNAEADWSLNIVSADGNGTKTFHEPFFGIRVRTNTAPEIMSVTGITASDTLESGFSSRTISVSISDPDNDASGYNDNQTLKLEIRNRDNVPRDLYFQRTDPLGMITFTIDSTLAAGLKTNNRYDFRFIATDLYGESDSLLLPAVRIENMPPEIIEITHPDTINTAEQGVFWIRSAINDAQGNLSFQDIDRVEIEINSYVFFLLDDGEFATSGDEVENDGIYSIGFSYDAGDSGTFDIAVAAYDKAGNSSSPYQSSIFLEPGATRKKIGNNNESTVKYINPFSAR